MLIVIVIFESSHNIEKKGQTNDEKFISFFILKFVGLQIVYEYSLNFDDLNNEFFMIIGSEKKALIYSLFIRKF